MYQYKCRYVSNYDGDGFVGDIDLGFGIVIRQTIRLNGVDTPELKTGDYRELAKQARDWLTAKLSDQPLRIETFKPRPTDKYGRVLANVYVGEDKVHISDQLLAAGLAVPYAGGTKSQADFAALLQ